MTSPMYPVQRSDYNWIFNECDLRLPSFSSSKLQSSFQAITFKDQTTLRKIHLAISKEARRRSLIFLLPLLYLSVSLSSSFSVCFYFYFFGLVSGKQMSWEGLYQLHFYIKFHTLINPLFYLHWWWWMGGQCPTMGFSLTFNFYFSGNKILGLKI